MKVGQWCLELFQNHDKMLSDPAHHSHYEIIFTEIIKLAIDLLNTDKPKIGRHIIEFLSFWIQALKTITKPELFHSFYTQALIAILNVTV